MELLTRNNFEVWMQKLMERLDRQDELLLATSSRTSSGSARNPAASVFTASRQTKPKISWR